MTSCWSRISTYRNLFCLDFIYFTLHGCAFIRRFILRFGTRNQSRLRHVITQLLRLFGVSSGDGMRLSRPTDFLCPFLPSVAPFPHINGLPPVSTSSMSEFPLSSEEITYSILLDASQSSGNQFHSSCGVGRTCILE